MTDVKVAVLLARLSNTLESARLSLEADKTVTGLADVRRAQGLVEQIRSEL